MKAELIYRTRVEVTTNRGKRLVVVMDLFKLPEAKSGFPEGYRFSWIAFDSDNPKSRVLFDCHPPKGPHIHIDGDKDGEPYDWNGLAEAERFFRRKLKEHFGELKEDIL